MKILGEDPGMHGGLAIVELIDGAAPQLIDATDIPVAGVGAKERVDAIALRKWITTHRPQLAFIERAQAMRSKALPDRARSAHPQKGSRPRRNRFDRVSGARHAT